VQLLTCEGLGSGVYLARPHRLACTGEHQPDCLERRGRHRRGGPRASRVGRGPAEERSVKVGQLLDQAFIAC